MPTYSLVIPAYNEEAVIEELTDRLVELMDALDGDAEAILVDDGSQDLTYELMLTAAQADARFCAVHLSRNFGHQIALTAGLDLAGGDAVVIMDADLQDPPELVLEFAKRWREGYEVVYGVRSDRLAEAWWRRSVIGLYYRILRKMTEIDIPPDAGDFRLVDRRALDAFNAMRERTRYVRGMFAWVGFRQIGVPYKRGARFAGETKYPLRKLIKLGADGVISFSALPLRGALVAGLMTSLAAFLFGAAAIGMRIADVGNVPGWASIVTVVAFLGGVQLGMAGMTGLYIARIYDEVKQRPLYVVDAVQRFGADGAEARFERGF